ncbi:unnamed protein product [Zymoseptoria tritici ST99CH_1A5]|uniref:Uncharacterized protein n=1 Tax=Zymoseptoria tritici ST99CH_1A5 TaxID=1276529 RepID=A0A1Y6M086_ZYMTR|nr:unnamed protein product [Zymoseptoria tritici ST99CH_1A5]
MNSIIGALLFLSLLPALHILCPVILLSVVLLADDGPCSWTRIANIVTVENSRPTSDVVCIWHLQKTCPDHLGWHTWYSRLSPDRRFSAPQDLVDWTDQYLLKLLRLDTAIAETTPTTQHILSTDWESREGIRSDPSALRRLCSWLYFFPAPTPLQTAYEIEATIKNITTFLRPHVLDVATAWNDFPWQTLSKELSHPSAQPDAPPTASSSSIVFYLRQVAELPSRWHPDHRRRLLSLRANTIAAHARLAALTAFQAHAHAHSRAASDALGFLNIYDQIMAHHTALGRQRLNEVGNKAEYFLMITRTVLPRLDVLVHELQGVSQAGRSECRESLQGWSRAEEREDVGDEDDRAPAVRRDGQGGDGPKGLLAPYWKVKEAVWRWAGARLDGARCPGVVAWGHLLRSEREAGRRRRQLGRGIETADTHGCRGAVGED